MFLFGRPRKPALGQLLTTIGLSEVIAYLPETRTIVSREAASHFVRGYRNVSQLLCICFFCISSHSRDGENLFVLDNALVELIE